MWRLEKVKIENFISHRDTEINFNIGKTTLVQGENLDDDGQESNGSGKSVILEALSYLLLGTSLKKVKDVELIYDKDDKVKYAYLYLKLFNSHLDQDLIIERWIHTKKSSELQITVNGDIVIDKNDKLVSEGDRLILEDLLQISREDIINFYLISKERYKSFFKSSDTDIKQIISRFSGADSINGVDELIKQDINAKDSLILDLQKKLIELDAKISVYNEGIQNEDLEKKRTEMIASLNSEIETYQNDKIRLNEKIEIEKESIITNQKKVVEFNQMLSIKTKDLSEFKDEKEAQQKIDDIKKNIEKINEKKKTVKSEIDTLSSEIQEFQQFLTETENNVAGAIKCPKCKFEFSLGKDDIDIEEARKSIPTIKEEISILRQEVDKNKEIGKQLSDEIEKFESYKTDYFKKIEQSNKAKSIIQNSINLIEIDIKKYNRLIKQSEEDIQSYQLRINKNQEKIKSIKDQIEVVKTKKLESCLTEYQNNIQLCNDKKNAINSQLLVLSDEKYKISQWLVNFTKFRSHLANKAVKSIENFANYYLSLSKSNLQLSIDGYKALANGDIREKISPNILRNGLMSGSYGKLSEGEKARIEIATINALQMLININCNSGGVDAMFIDDVLGGVDSCGTKLIAKAFNNIKKTLYLFTHISLQSESGFEVLTIQKNKGVSYVKA